MKRTILFSVLMLACTKRELRYEDDVDIAGIRAAFKCDPGPVRNDRAAACRILGDFASGTTFTDAPAKGLETWFGRKVCTDSIDSPTRMDFGRVHLMPGVGKAIFPSDVKTDPSRDLPYGAQFIAASASNFTPDMKAGYLRALEAAEKGTPPSFEGLSEKSSLELFWDGTKKPPGTPDFYRLVKSKGTSILGGPSTTGAATYYVRAMGNRMLVLYPSSTPCVAELWKI